MMACSQITNLSTRWGWRRSTEKNDIIEDTLKEQCRVEPQPKSLGSCPSVVCSGSSTGRSGSPRKLKISRSMSSINLRKELQDFICANGLPSDQVPSMKELSQHGRQDLANIVRRRGYIAVAQLLTDPEKSHTTKSETRSQTDRSTAETAGMEYTDPDRSDSVQLSNLSPHTELGGSDDSYTSFIKEQGDTPDQYSDVSHLCSMKDWSGGEHLVSTSPETVNTVGGNSHYSLKSSLSISLRKNAADFVRTGEFHDIEDGAEIEEYSGVEETDDNTYGTYELDDAIPLAPDSVDNEKASYGLSECESSSPLFSGGKASSEDAHVSCESNGCTPLISDIKSATNSALLTTKLQPYFRDELSNVFNTSFNGQPQFNVDGIPKESEVQSDSAHASQMELDHLKSGLRLKELELVKIRQELEEEKAALSFIHAKAMAEVADAKRMVSEKYSQLSAIDQVLTDLKQVKIEYWTHGRKVEVTGSFNGWQHNISMEPDFSSEIQNPNGARGPLIWSTELWLYPGIYEIKFIVDGNWQLDYGREVITRDMIQNNLLKVEH